MVWGGGHVRAPAPLVFEPSRPWSVVAGDEASLYFSFSDAARCARVLKSWLVPLLSAWDWILDASACVMGFLSCILRLLTAAIRLVGPTRSDTIYLWRQERESTESLL